MTDKTVRTAPSAALLASTRQTTCYAAVCAVPGCGYVLDAEECEERHYDTPQKAYDDAIAFTWTVDARGYLICPADDDEHQAARQPADRDDCRTPGPGQIPIAMTDA